MDRREASRQASIWKKKRVWPGWSGGAGRSGRIASELPRGPRTAESLHVGRSGGAVRPATIPPTMPGSVRQPMRTVRTSPPLASLRCVLTRTRPKNRPCAITVCHSRESGDPDYFGRRHGFGLTGERGRARVAMLRKKKGPSREGPSKILAPRDRFELPTRWLTATCSAS